MKSSKSSTVLVAVAWITILAITLPKIILQEIFHFPVSENLQYQIAFPVLLAGLVLVFVVKTLRPLRLFFGLFLVLVCAQWLVYTRLDQLPIYQRWLQDPSFNIYMLAEQSLHLVVTLAIIVFLWIVKKNFMASSWRKGIYPHRWSRCAGWVSRREKGGENLAGSCHLHQPGHAGILIIAGVLRWHL
jgi:hypothetical protein